MYNIISFWRDNNSSDNKRPKIKQLKTLYVEGDKNLL